MSDPIETARLVRDHLRAGLGASVLVAVLIATTVFVVALGPRAAAAVATAELRHQLAQADQQFLDLHGDGRIGLPVPEDGTTLDDMVGSTDTAIAAIPSKLPQPLRDATGEAQWFARSIASNGGHPVDPAIVLSVRLAVDLDWLDRVEFVDGAAPETWVLPPAEDAVEQDADGAEPAPEPVPIEIALSQRIASAMAVQAGDLLDFSPVPYLITGVFEPIDPDDSYWSHGYDLQNPTEIRESGMPPKIQASVFVASGSIVPLHEVFAAGILTAWVPLDPAVYEYVDLPTLATQSRNLIATPLALPNFGQVNLGTTLPVLLDEVRATVSATTALIALAASGLLGVLIATYALSIQALVRRRSTALALASARGASGWQLRGLMVLEAAIIAVPGSALAIAGAALLVPERVGLDGWLAPAVLGLTPVVLAALLVNPGALREGRRDVAVRSRSPLRWVLEAAVAGAAVVSLVLLQRRGLVASSDLVGIDPLLAATPLLVAATVGLLALRLYPIPLRIVRGMARKRTAPVWEVGSARAVREPAIGDIAALALVIGVSIVVFTTVMISTVGVAMEAAARERVAADVQIAAHDLPDGLVEEIRQVDGVQGAVALTTKTGLTLTDDAGGTRLGVVLVDPAALQTVRPDLPPLVGATPGSLPVLVSADLAAQIQGTDLMLGEVPVTQVGVVSQTSMPTMQGLWLIIDESAAADLDIVGQIPSRVLVSLGGVASGNDWDPATVDTIESLVRGVQPEQFAGSMRVIDVNSELGRTRAAPITSGLERSLVLVAVATLVLTILVVALASAASAATRSRVVGVLRILGMDAGQVRRLVVWEFAPVAVASILVGTLVGVLLPFLVTAVLDLRAFFGGSVLPEPSLDPLWIVVAVGAYALAIVTAVLVASALGRRFAPASTLKMGEP